jgi:hypothetical protein
MNEMDFTELVGNIAMVILLGTIAYKLFMVKLDPSQLKGLLLWVGAIVIGVWAIKILPKDPVATLDMSGCQSFENWTECNGWPIFMSFFADFARSFGDSITRLVTFGPQMAATLAGLWFAVRITNGRYFDAEGVWKTTLGVIFILIMVIYLPWIFRSISEKITELSGMEGTFQAGRSNLSSYLSAVESYKAASKAYSSSVFDFPYYAFVAVLWVALLVPTLVGVVAYVAQLLVLYGVPFSILLVVFTQWQDLSLPFLLILRVALASIIKGLTWMVVAKIEPPSAIPSNEFEAVSLGLDMWGHLGHIAGFAAIYGASGYVLYKFILGPAIQTLFNPRSS